MKTKEIILLVTVHDLWGNVEDAAKVFRTSDSTEVRNILIALPTQEVYNERSVGCGQYWLQMGHFPLDKTSIPRVSFIRGIISGNSKLISIICRNL
jgi:hypothetical protein